MDARTDTVLGTCKRLSNNIQPPFPQHPKFSLQIELDTERATILDYIFLGPTELNLLVFILIVPPRMHASFNNIVRTALCKSCHFVL